MLFISFYTIYVCIRFKSLSSLVDLRSQVSNGFPSLYTTVKPVANSTANSWFTSLRLLSFIRCPFHLFYTCNSQFSPPLLSLLFFFVWNMVLRHKKGKEKNSSQFNDTFVLCTAVNKNYKSKGIFEAYVVLHIKKKVVVRFKLICEENSLKWRGGKF